MEKYPIVSKNGNKYLVEINRWIDTIEDTYSKIEVYIYDVKRGFFGKKLEKLYYKKFAFNSPEFHDYILATQNTVNYYEASSSYILNENEIQTKKRFKEWDGIVK